MLPRFCPPGAAPFLAGMLLSLTMVATAALPAGAFSGTVTKQSFELPAFTTVGGRPLKAVRVGWESYGTLNAAHDNVILITHYFSGTSHAAGRYQPEDARPGYWDAVIGPGKAIDTDRFFVISSDTLVNLNAKDPAVITTGPASLDPDTGKPYGLRFPIVTIRDFVNVQKALLDSLGIRRLHAVIGASMGSLQAIEWAAAYPEMVERVVSVSGAGQADAFLIAWLNTWATPIRLDPAWNHGDYYGGPGPIAGLTAALKLVSLQARNWPWAVANFGRTWADQTRDPAEGFDNQYKVESWLEETARTRAAVSDANHFLYLVKANQTFLVGGAATLEDGLSKVRAPVLLLPAEGDLVFFPEHGAEAMAEVLEAQNTPVAYEEISGDLGHLNGIVYLAGVGETLKGFLETAMP